MGNRDRIEIVEDSDRDGGSENSGGEEDAKPKASTTPTVVNFAEIEAKQKARRVARAKKTLTRKEKSAREVRRIERIEVGLVRPDASTNRERERRLRQLATKGVVQLFNAIAERQRAAQDQH